jgi:uncharacterized RDD family membrane protein YckC
MTGWMAQPLYDAAQVETPEQIELTLPLAGIGSRSVAYLLDLLCQVIPITLAAVVAFTLVPLAADAEIFGKNAAGVPELETAPLAILSLTIFVVNFGYFALFETFWRGQSPGKRWVGLRVVKDGGFALDGRAALVRNLLRVVDFLPAFYVAGMASIFLTGSGKRIGDYAAGTIVVRERKVSDLTAIAPTSLNDAVTAALGAEELALLTGFLDRRSSLDPAARDRLAAQLAARFAKRLGRPVPSDHEAFLEMIAPL